MRIGEISLGPEFEGLLPWGHIDNRPFMRCMHGFGLCLWRLERFEEAEASFLQALSIDASYAPARQSLAGVQAELERRRSEQVNAD